MSNRERRKPPSQRGDRSSAPDYVALSRIARPVGASRATVGGDALPMIEPLEAPEDHMDFDKAICAAGLKAFVRPRTDTDWPDVAILPESLRYASGYAHVLVQELAPGVRYRVPVHYSPPSDLN